MLSHKRSISLAVRGTVAIFFAIGIMFVSGATLGLVLIVVFYTFVDGLIIAVFASWAFANGTRCWWLLALEAVAGIGFALATFVWLPAMSGSLLYFVALWAVITGVLETVAGFSMEDSALRVSFVIGGVLSCALGISLAAFAHLDRAALAWVIATYAFAAGSVLVVAAIRTRHHATTT